MQGFNYKYRNVIKGVTFFLILAMLFVIMSLVTENVLMDRDRLVPVRNKNFYRIRREKTDSIDVIIVGNSLSYSAISPMRFWKEHGFTAYACGQSGQTIRETEEMLKTALSVQTPRVVILETDVLFNKNNQITRKNLDKNIIGALYDSGSEVIMNTPDTPIKISKRTIDTKGSSEGKKGERNKRQQFVRGVSIFLFVLLISFAAVLVKAYFDGEFRSVAALQKYIGRYGAFGPVFLAAFQAIQVVVPVLPGFLGCAAGSVMFGPAVGFWCNYIGIGGGSIIAFFLARKYGMPLLDDLFPSGRYNNWSVWASKSKSYTGFLFMAMLLPLFPDDFLCYLTGVSKMTAKRFIWIILLGKPWCILAYSLGFSLIK